MAEVVTSRSGFSKIMNVARLGGMIDDIQLCFKPEYLEIKVRNPENTLGCYARFDRTYFDSYSVDEETKIAFSIGRRKSKIEKILKLLESRRGGLRISWNDESLTINEDEFIIPLKGYNDAIELPTFDLKNTDFGFLLQHGSISIDDYNYTEISIPKSINLLGTENLTFVVKNSSLFVKQEDELGYKLKTEISTLVSKYVKDVTVTVDATLIDYAFKTIDAESCFIAVGERDGLPLPIQIYSGDSTHGIVVLIAPKVEE